MKVYVASSWRNQYQPAVVSRLRAEGHEVYDFRNPGPERAGFGWPEVDPQWQSWTPGEFIRALAHPVAIAGYESDYQAMQWADAVVLVMPCGRSAHLELGWASGAGKHTAILLTGDSEPELMYKLVDRICTSLGEVCDFLREKAPRQVTL